MFREMRRFKQQVSQDECKKILKDEKRAAFSVIGDEGYPYTIPINFYYEEADHTIYFHGAREGHKMDAIQKCNKVCLTTWNQGFKKEGHWEWNATSVVVFGKAELITDTKIIEDRLRKLAEKYYPTVEEVEKEMNGSARSRVQLFAISGTISSTPGECSKSALSAPFKAIVHIYGSNKMNGINSPEE